MLIVHKIFYLIKINLKFNLLDKKNFKVNVVYSKIKSSNYSLRLFVVIGIIHHTQSLVNQLTVAYLSYLIAKNYERLT